jgi:DNA-binding response OmpR family regulator
MKVLLVGDDQHVMKHISFSLRLRWPSTTVVSAAMGSKGIELVEAETPDLVMADFSLPDMRCADLVASIREFSSVPLIVLDGHTTAIERAELLEIGADQCFVRPFWPAEVQARVNALLRRSSQDDLEPGHMPFVMGNLEINSATRQISSPAYQWN